MDEKKETKTVVEPEVVSNSESSPAGVKKPEIVVETKFADGLKPKEPEAYETEDDEEEEMDPRFVPVATIIERECIIFEEILRGSVLMAMEYADDPDTIEDENGVPQPVDKDKMAIQIEKSEIAKMFIGIGSAWEGFDETGQAKIASGFMKPAIMNTAVNIAKSIFGEVMKTKEAKRYVH